MYPWGLYLEKSMRGHGSYIMDARVLGKLYKVLHTVLIVISSLQIANSIREAGIKHDCYQVGLVLGTSRGRMINDLGRRARSVNSSYDGILFFTWLYICSANVLLAFR